MQTFTLDSQYGEMNTNIKWIETKHREKLSKVIEEYTKDCMDNDVEMSSADGVFLEMVFQELTTSRLKLISKRKKLQRITTNK